MSTYIISQMCIGGNNFIYLFFMVLLIGNLPLLCGVSVIGVLGLLGG